MTEWGERELERAGLARIDWANRVNIASALTLNKYQNKTYFFGVSGLQNYGLLNDPSLSAAISPTTKAAGGTGWANATANEVLNDVAKLFQQLQSQANGLLSLLFWMPIIKCRKFSSAIRRVLESGFPTMELHNCWSKNLVIP